jgi:Asp-tRNA(Asn)/Glu-tRNA(Gln) amidotransferase A subunit family amidase
MEETKNSFIKWSALAREAPERLVDQFLRRLELLTPEIRQAFIASCPGRDSLIEQIEASVLNEDAVFGGVPYMLQDLFDVQGLPTRCGAPFQDLFDAPLDESSALYTQLENLGTILLAKTVPAEFGVGARGRNKHFGDCPHADSLQYICGGGAGSSAYAVSAGWAPIAFGLDSSAGIRIPAAFHGLFGFRMGRNDFARTGVFPIVPTLESVGWVCAQCEDLQTAITAFYPQSGSGQSKGPRGYLLDDPSVALEPELKRSLMGLIRHLDTDDCPTPNKALCHALNQVGEAFTTIEGRELYAIHKYWIEESRPNYDEDLLAQIEVGQRCNAIKAELAAAIQQTARENMAAFFIDYDYLIVPISPVPSPEKSIWNEQLENDLLRLNATAGLIDLPALILPFACGRGRQSAVQLILNPKKLHLTSAILEQVSNFYEV